MQSAYTKIDMQSGYDNFENIKYSRENSIVELKRFAQFIIDNADRITNEHFDKWENDLQNYLDKGIIKEKHSSDMSLYSQMYNFKAEYGFTTQKLNYPNSEIYNINPISHISIDNTEQTSKLE